MQKMGTEMEEAILGVVVVVDGNQKVESFRRIF